MNNLKKMREEKGFSLQALADICGTSKQRIYELEKPDSNPTLKTAYSIAVVFDVDVTEIWPDEIEIIEETITIRRVKK